MISSFRFNSYKIDKVNLSVAKDLFVLIEDAPSKDAWSFSVSIRKPQFFEGGGLYIGGVNCKIALKNPHHQKEAVGTVGQEHSLQLEMGIAGAFSTDGRIDSQLEENLVRSQIPGILFPYLRAAATNLLASAGFGSVVLPLVNIQEVAKSQLARLQIEVVPAPSSSDPQSQK